MLPKQNSLHYAFQGQGEGSFTALVPTPSSRQNGGLGTEAPVIFFEGRAVFIHHTEF